jgi:hypothetical protein
LVIGLYLVGTLACASQPDPSSQPREKRILGKWENYDKCLVSKMEFLADGTVLYDVGHEANFRQGFPGSWEFSSNGWLLGSWKFTEDGLLELEPQPLYVPEPRPKGQVRVTFDNSSGRDTLSFANGGLFGRRR